LSDEYFSLGSVRKFNANTIGKPGQRTFRLLMESDIDSACIWIEKQQLLELSLLLRQLLRDYFENNDISFSANLTSLSEIAQINPSIEFTVVRLNVNFDDSTRLWIMEAYNSDDSVGNDPTLKVEIQSDILLAFVDEALAICGAGRPLCPLCGNPINEETNHVCPLKNGHIKH
jgi:uncharacterized repeat protein (TIGR03847 family)